MGGKLVVNFQHHGLRTWQKMVPRVINVNVGRFFIYFSLEFMLWQVDDYELAFLFG